VSNLPKAVTQQCSTGSRTESLTLHQTDATFPELSLSSLCLSVCLVPTRNRVDLWRNSCTSLLYFVMRVRCRYESSRSLSHLLMRFFVFKLLTKAKTETLVIKRRYLPMTERTRAASDVLNRRDCAYGVIKTTGTK